MFKGKTMKHFSALFVIFGLLSIAGCSGKKSQNSLLIITPTNLDINHTIEAFKKKLIQQDGNYTVLHLTEHHKIAEKQNIYLKPTISVTIANRLISSALLTCNPSVALEFPLRVSIYIELGGAVKIAYTNPEYWTLKHNIKDKNCISIITKMAREFDEASQAVSK